MNGRVIGIERVAPRKGLAEAPVWNEEKGYQMGDPAHGSEKHHAKNAVWVRSLDEVATLIERGFSLRMAAKGVAPSLVSPGGLRILRDGNQAGG